MAEQKLLFEDTVAYANNYWKDVQAREADPNKVTLGGIQQQNKNHPNYVVDTFLPHPGKALVEKMGEANVAISELYLLSQQLFDNPSVNYPEEVQEKIFNQLTSITEMLESISHSYDSWQSNAEEEMLVNAPDE